MTDHAAAERQPGGGMRIDQHSTDEVRGMSELMYTAPELPSSNEVAA
ncbi:MAG TPA: hypothetical protein VFW65_11090 [Pseudonocardiaceae bacterium]|nr:hypothetical protein [Pseudonocardiaceae bacterium]